MDKIPAMVSMKRTPEEVKETVMPVMAQSEYPYGLCISLCEDELEKLGFAQGDLNVGDMLHLHCMTTVTSVSEHDNVNSGPSCRVELQITNIAAESEDEENEAAKQSRKTSDKISKLYSK